MNAPQTNETGGVLAILRDGRRRVRMGSRKAADGMDYAIAAVADLIEKANSVAWNARMTAPEDTYHEVPRADMEALIAALARVGGAS